MKRYGVLAVVTAVATATGVATLGLYRTNYTGLVVSPDLGVLRLLVATGWRPPERILGPPRRFRRVG